MLKIFAVFFFSFFIIRTIQAQIVSDTAAIKKRPIFQLPAPLGLSSLTVVPKDFTVKHLPFFCDKEYKFEKLTKIPFRFRLGSVEYCDKLEGKHQ